MMEMILSNVAALSHDWRAWLVTALVALKAMHSIYHYIRCPVLCRRAVPSQREIEAARAYRLKPPRSFLIIMLTGMALAIGGLYAINNEIYGPLGLGALVVGIFMFTTEPNRLSVKSAVMEVYASTGRSGESVAIARDNLRSAHRMRAGIEAALAAAVIAFLYFT